jgi:hypothetical protein
MDQATGSSGPQYLKYGRIGFERNTFPSEAFLEVRRVAAENSVERADIDKEARSPVLEEPAIQKHVKAGLALVTPTEPRCGENFSIDVACG